MEESLGVPGWIGLIDRTRARALALGELAVPAHVAVLAAGDQVHGGLVAEVLDLAHRAGVHPGHPAGTEVVARAVAEGHGDAAAVHEVELLLLVVVVAAGPDAGGKLDRGDSESGG